MGRYGVARTGVGVASSVGGVVAETIAGWGALGSVLQEEASGKEAGGVGLNVWKEGAPVVQCSIQRPGAGGDGGLT